VIFKLYKKVLSFKAIRNAEKVEMKAEIGYFNIIGVYILKNKGQALDRWSIYLMETT
jgi:hypothetical protein